MTDELLTTQGIADMLKLCREHVTNRLTKRPGFPAPKVNTSRKHRLWSAAEVMAWAAGSKPRRDVLG
jgi:hypothetical protein